MSRALILMAQTRFLKRPLTAQETADCLEAWRLAAGGKIIRIPKPRDPQAELFNTAASLRENGFSIRHIAKKLKLSKSQVHAKLSEKSAIEHGQDPA